MSKRDGSLREVFFGWFPCGSCLSQATGVSVSELDQFLSLTIHKNYVFCQTYESYIYSRTRCKEGGFDSSQMNNASSLIFIFNFNYHPKLMKRVLKAFLKSSERTVVTHNRGLSAQPIKQWKRNAFAVLAGLGLGLYIGQYFPDNFYADVEAYLPEIEQLKEVSPLTEKPNPLYPKSLFDYPEDALAIKRKAKDLPEGTFEVVNDVTRKKQQFKVTRVFNPDVKEE